MAQVPTGSTFYVASGHCRSETVSVTNASEAVVTSTAHGYSNGDIVISVQRMGSSEQTCIPHQVGLNRYIRAGRLRHHQYQFFSRLVAESAP